MRLYDSALAPNPRRVRIFMSEKGIVPDEVIPIDILKRENLAPEFYAKNPMGKLPVLELDDGTLLSESVAICRYLEETHPEPPLFGADARERALVEMWQRRAELEALLPVGFVFRNRHPRFEDRAFAGIDAPLPQIPQLAEQGETLARVGFDVLDRQLAEHPFVAGDRLSIADITALCAVDFGRVARLDALEGRAHLGRWYGEMSQRPSARA